MRISDWSSDGCSADLVSGLIKNALDYVQDMAKDERVYFEGRAVGLIAVAAGWQATGTTLATLRSITHALRGWPTPMAVAVNSMMPILDEHKRLTEQGVSAQGTEKRRAGKEGVSK